MATRLATRLGLATLADLPERVGRPRYARADLSPGIVHFGVGNFHRAHMQVYLDRLMNAGRDLDWAIVGAGVTPYDARMRDALAGQDWLSTVVEQSAETSAAFVTGVMTDFLPPMDGRAILARLTDPATRIVSLTVTEGGYFIDPATGAFDPDHLGDRRRRANPDDPKTVFGLILAGLRARRAAGRPPFTVLSCDNIPHNGVVACNTVAGLAEAQDPALAAWVREPSPSRTAWSTASPRHRRPRARDRPRRVRRRGRLAGVLRGLHPVGRRGLLPRRPPGPRGGRRPVRARRHPVRAHEDPHPERRPRDHRLPRGPPRHPLRPRGHGPPAGPRLPREGRDRGDPPRSCRRSPTPTSTTTSRSSSAAATTRRSATPSAASASTAPNRQPKFIIPSIADRLDRGLPVEGLALATALWARYCAGRTDSGAMIEPNDPSWDRLTAQAEAAREDPAAWLAMRDIYGQTADAPAFRDAFARWLAALWSDGTEATLRRYLA